MSRTTAAIQQLKDNEEKARDAYGEAILELNHARDKAEMLRQAHINAQLALTARLEGELLARGGAL